MKQKVGFAIGSSREELHSRSHFYFSSRNNFPANEEPTGCSDDEDDHDIITDEETQ